MSDNLEKKAYDWVRSEKPTQIEEAFYCQTRDVFQARLGKMISSLLAEAKISESDVYILSAIAGEIGNNSFDHNLGSWPDLAGTFFGYELDDGKITIVLADRGQGVFNTLQRVKPELKDDAGALFSAFNEKISGRAPESRGNGLKFVKQSVKDIKAHLTFMSGKAKVILSETEEIGASDGIIGAFAVIKKS